jgi:hypothetical protein
MARSSVAPVSRRPCFIAIPLAAAGAAGGSDPKRRPFGVCAALLELGIPVLEVLLLTNRPNKIADVVENPVRVLRVTGPNSRFDEPPVIRKYSAARRLVPRNTRGADHPARRSRARQHPRAGDVGIWN